MVAIESLVAHVDVPLDGETELSMGEVVVGYDALILVVQIFRESHHRALSL